MEETVGASVSSMTWVVPFTVYGGPAQRHRTGKGEAMAQFGMECFDENRSLFSNSREARERWNLYNGLAGMAQDLYQLDAKIGAMQQDLQALGVAIQTIQRMLVSSQQAKREGP